MHAETPQPDIWREHLSWRFPLHPSSQSSVNPVEGGKKIVGVRREGGHQGTQPTESTKQGAYELTEAEAASMGPAGFAPCPLRICYWCQLGGFL